MYNIPILFIVFNRIEPTKQVFAKIKEVAPKQLFIAMDGPRKNIQGEAEKCENVRNWVLSQIDWDCELHTLIREENLGCGKGPAEAISWFFDQVEMGIILEDDCLPNDSFFKFMEELLVKYKDDNRIMQISGTNRLGTYQYKHSSQSYYFAKYASEWGWGTWRRAWNLYDFEMSAWEDNNVKKIIRQTLLKDEYYRILERIFDKTFKNPQVSWWDYQWGFAKDINNGLSIVPAKNLVSNIGFGVDATHTLNIHSKFNNLTAHEIDFPLHHPKYVAIDKDLEKKILDAHFSFFIRIFNFIGKIRGKFHVLCRTKSKHQRQGI